MAGSQRQDADRTLVREERYSHAARAPLKRSPYVSESVLATKPLLAIPVAPLLEPELLPGTGVAADTIRDAHVQVALVVNDHLTAPVGSVGGWPLCRGWLQADWRPIREFDGSATEQSGIAEWLVITEGTVEVHVKHILSKQG